jgi:NTE family protein
VTDPSGPRRLTPGQVRYLAFEGGGAKGLAFIGALTALEALGVQLRAGQHGTVRGLSGASAGSITAFLYAMRFTPEQLIEIQMADRAFTRFFQPPEPNVVRAVTRAGYERGHPMVRWVGPTRTPLKVFDEAVTARRLSLATFPLQSSTAVVKYVLGTRVANVLHTIARSKVRAVARKNPELAPLIMAVTASQPAFFDYCYSLLFDLGLFSGTEVRLFLKEQMAQFLGRTGSMFPAMRSGDLDRIDVAQFTGMTETAVAFAGTNITTGRSAYFRAAPNTNAAADTPTFPVLDAVAISSAYPLAFKPYVVYGRRDVDNGYWLDGGVQNNFPLHAFDSAPDAPLDPGMLGIRLEESARPIAAFVDDLSAYINDVSVLGFLVTHLVGLLSAAMYPTESGQIRTPQEQAQTVEIRIPGDVLSTLSFAPDRTAAGTAILIAFDAVADYFVPGFDPDRPAASPSPQETALRDARKALRAKLATG